MAPVGVVKTKALGGLGGIAWVVNICNRDGGGERRGKGRSRMEVLPI